MLPFCSWAMMLIPFCITRTFGARCAPYLGNNKNLLKYFIFDWTLFKLSLHIDKTKLWHWNVSSNAVNIFKVETLLLFSQNINNLIIAIFWICSSRYCNMCYGENIKQRLATHILYSIHTFSKENGHMHSITC